MSFTVMTKLQPTSGEYGLDSHHTINFSLHHSLKAILESTRSCICGLPGKLFPQLIGSGSNTSDVFWEVSGVNLGWDSMIWT
jgi:hypothetical protein